LSNASYKAKVLNRFLLDKGTFNLKQPNAQIEKSLDTIYNQIIPGIVGSGILTKKGKQNITEHQNALLKIQLLEREL
jgi:hypothetical protein